MHVLNVHGAVACGEMRMEQLHVHVIRMWGSLRLTPISVKITGG